ncbi:M10 family metallopeptidase [Ferirhizobium litorale]|uniref:M10 family metallopeptidase n=1 Tax=Ferirhizobium litorale TaxID=2927786 RepID=UPI002892F88E|nr:M10 family metallopeptidase [Fererhizobium litorale]
MNNYVDYLVKGEDGKAHRFDHTTITVNLEGLKDSPQMYDSALAALNAWEVTTGLRFNVVTNAGADIVFNNDGQGSAYASTSYNGSGYTTSAEVNVSKDWMNGFPASERWGDGSYGQQTFIHEIGHALGLNHGGPYDGSGTYSKNAIFDIDTHQYSVMSYFSQSEYRASGASDINLSSPMIADVMAIQELYGNLSVNAGNTVYGKGAAAALRHTDLGQLSDSAYTIMDTGGLDTLDFSNAMARCVVDLRPGSFSDVNGNKGNVTIAQGTVIEIACGSAYRDTIVGNGAGNTLYGGGNSDKLTGSGGADRLLGQYGHDVLVGGYGKDTLSGGGGNDRLAGNGGTDRLTGGAGSDVFVFAHGGGRDTVTDFQDGTDRIQIKSPSIEYSDIDISDSGGSAIVAFDNIKIVLDGINASQLTASDFIL